MVDRKEYISKLEDLSGKITWMDCIIDDKYDCGRGVDEYIESRFGKTLCKCDYHYIKDFAKIRLIELKEEARELLNLIKSEV